MHQQLINCEIDTSKIILKTISFFLRRFHFQRGDQYRRRREELEDKPFLNGAKPPVETTAMLEKGSDAGWDKYPTIAKTIPDHLSLFLQFSQTQDDDIPRKSALKQSDSGQFYDAKRTSSNEPSICSGGRNRPSYRSRMPALNEPAVAFADKSSTRRNLFALAQLAPKSKNVAFTFNANGSMVDVRCNEEERSNTFRINEKSDINQNNCDYRSGLEYKSSSLSSKGSKQKRLEGNLTQSLERHAFKGNSKPAIRYSNPPLTSVHSVDYSTYLHFNSQLNNFSHVSQYQSIPLHFKPSQPPCYNSNDKCTQPASSSTSVKMVDAATSPGLALKSSRHKNFPSPYHTIQISPNDPSSPGNE